MLEKAVMTAPGKLDTSDILIEAHRGVYLLWVVALDGDVTAAITTRIIEYPKARGLALDWVGGTRMREWFAPTMRVMKEHAVRNECTHMEGYGRDAWLRWIGPEGWKKDYTAFRMELSDGQ